jgi:hypothetical protein
MIKYVLIGILSTVYAQAFWCDRGLDGLHLTSTQILQIAQGIKPTFLGALYSLERVQEALFWHLYFPTTGLMLKKPFYPPPYPYPPHYFSIHELAPRKGKGVIIALIDTGVAAFHTDTSIKHPDLTYRAPIYGPLPAPEVPKQGALTIGTHGTHIYGIIAATNDMLGLQGIAPKATTCMIKAFSANGKTSIKTLIESLHQALTAKATILNLSLKFTNAVDMSEPTYQNLYKLLGSFPYVVAAAGNDGVPTMPYYRGCVEGYPARFSIVPFDVGAFGWHKKTVSIASFSQYEPTIGPLFAAPGCDILSTGLVAEQTSTDALYSFRGGTSMAATIMSGFLALVVGEFGDSFSREEIIKTCYMSTLKMHDNDDWSKKTILGVIDMRTVLFVLHTIKALRHSLSKDSCNKSIPFDCMLKAVRLVLFDELALYSKKHLEGINFQTNFMEYYQQSLKHSYRYQKKTFSYYIDQIVNTIKTAWVGNRVKRMRHRSPECVQSLIDLINTQSYSSLQELPTRARQKLYAIKTL